MRTATLVEPRVTLLLSLNRTKIRFIVGSKDTLPLPWTNIPNVGVAFALIVVVTLVPVAEMHRLVTGSVWQREMFIGKDVFPVSADAVILPLVPTFIVATAKAPVPLVPGIFAMPSLADVADSATMSGTGISEAEKSNVLRPVIIETTFVLAQTNPNSRSLGATAAVGVNAKTKLCAMPEAMFTGVLGLPMTALVVGLVA